jgi:glycosyltransferase involved in cell wall biosynthesis
MTVLFLNPAGTLGGAERSLLDLIASLRAAKPELSIGLIQGGEGALTEEAEKLGVKVRVLPLPERLARTGEHALGGVLAIAKGGPALVAATAGLGSYALTLRREIRAFAPAIVHSNGIKTHLLSALVPLGGAPLVWHIRDFVGQRAVMAHVLRAVAWRPAALVAISRSVAEDVGRALGRKDAVVVYNGIDTTRFTPDGERAELDALAGLARPKGGTLRIGLVATYARWKGQAHFLEAAARVAKGWSASAGGEVRFYVIGGRTYATENSQFSREELAGEIARLGLRDVAGLVPFQSDPARAYRALDVVVHASTRPEPFGRTIAEAMACGKPVVVAREGGAAELVEDGVDAVAVAPRDPGALADAIAGLAREPERRERLGGEARRTATRRFARERIGPEVLEVYGGAGVRGVS